MIRRVATARSHLADIKLILQLHPTSSLSGIMTAPDIFSGHGFRIIFMVVPYEWKSITLATHGPRVALQPGESCKTLNRAHMQDSGYQLLGNWKNFRGYISDCEATS